MRYAVGLSVLLAALFALPGGLRAEWINTTSEVPLDRLIRNLEATVQKRPDDARAHYVLGRIHSMAYATGGDTLRLEMPKEGEEALPGFPPWDTVRQVGKDKPLTEERERHYRQSIRHYTRATTLAPDEALYHLGLGWMLEDGSVFAASLGLPETADLPPADLSEGERKGLEEYVRRLAADAFAVRQAAARALQDALPRSLPVLLRHQAHENPEVRVQIGHLLRRHFLDRALTAYRRVFALAAQSDAALESFGVEGDQALSLEAGKGIVRILKERERGEPEEAEISRVKEHLARLDQVPRWITPVVFPLDGAAPLEACVAEDATVVFDLDGDGMAGRWPWVKARTGILVWDPEGTGVVRSGRQMFGSVTWWMFWRHGYEPLAALDDDGNGWLEGAELDGIAVWCDANGNAVSDPGEVRPAGQLGIQGVSVRATPDREGSPSCPRGIRLGDGRNLPTYDWTPERR